MQRRVLIANTALFCSLLVSFGIVIGAIGAFAVCETNRKRRNDIEQRRQENRAFTIEAVNKMIPAFNMRQETARRPNDKKKITRPDNP